MACARGQTGGRENHQCTLNKAGATHTSHVLPLPTIRRNSLWGTSRTRTEKWPGVGNEVSGVSPGAPVGQAGESVEVRT